MINGIETIEQPFPTSPETGADPVQCCDALLPEVDDGCVEDPALANARRLLHEAQVAHSDVCKKCAELECRETSLTEKRNETIVQVEKLRSEKQALLTEVSGEDSFNKITKINGKITSAVDFANDLSDALFDFEEVLKASRKERTDSLEKINSCKRLFYRAVGDALLAEVAPTLQLAAVAYNRGGNFGDNSFEYKEWISQSIAPQQNIIECIEHINAEFHIPA